MEQARAIQVMSPFQFGILLKSVIKFFDTGVNGTDKQPLTSLEITALLITKVANLYLTFRSIAAIGPRLMYQEATKMSHSQFGLKM